MLDVACQPPHTFEHSNPDANTASNFTYRDEVLYTCHNNYKVSMNSNTYSSQCDAYGNWSVTQELCR